MGLRAKVGRFFTGRPVVFISVKPDVNHKWHWFAYLDGDYKAKSDGFEPYETSMAAIEAAKKIIRRPYTFEVVTIEEAEKYRNG